MAKVIRIFPWQTGSDGDPYLSFDLIDIARIIAPEGRKLSWAAFDIEGIGEVLIPQLSWMVSDLAFLRWDELELFASGVNQLFWGTFVGGMDGQLQSLDPAMEDAELYRRAEIVVQAFDSHYWIFFARDDALVEQVRASFKEVVEVPVPM